MKQYQIIKTENWYSLLSGPRKCHAVAEWKAGQVKIVDIKKETNWIPPIVSFFVSAIDTRLVENANLLKFSLTI